MQSRFVLRDSLSEAVIVFEPYRGELVWRRRTFMVHVGVMFLA
jgi:hypothetical protein